jgi:hypothetical protein
MPTLSAIELQEKLLGPPREYLALQNMTFFHFFRFLYVNLPSWIIQSGSGSETRVFEEHA